MCNIGSWRGVAPPPFDPSEARAPAGWSTRPHLCSARAFTDSSTLVVLSDRPTRRQAPPSPRPRDVGVPQPDDGARHVAALVLMGVTEGAIYWHLKQIYQKLPISRQVDLVRLVLSIAKFG